VQVANRSKGQKTVTTGSLYWARCKCSGAGFGSTRHIKTSWPSLAAVTEVKVMVHGHQELDQMRVQMRRPLQFLAPQWHVMTF
jgi:hypothetical protein